MGRGVVTREKRTVVAKNIILLSSGTGNSASIRSTCGALALFDALPYLGRYLLGQSIRLSDPDKLPTKVTSENKGNSADYEDAGGQHQDFCGIKSRKILAFILSCSVANRLGVGAIDPMGTR